MIVMCGWMKLRDVLAVIWDKIIPIRLKNDRFVLENCSKTNYAI